MRGTIQGKYKLCINMTANQHTIKQNQKTNNIISETAKTCGHTSIQALKIYQRSQREIGMMTDLVSLPA